jgi:hypothetical protein
MENVYKRNGYENRKEYLKMLSDMNGINLETVTYLAELLGENEDFDGLVTSLDDMHQGY